jgi:hypothetical protein
MMANKLNNPSGPPALPGWFDLARRWLRCALPMGVAWIAQTSRGEDQVQYRYESYVEDNHRMTVDTHSVFFEQQLVDAIIAKGELFYDSVSGATPTGTYHYPPSAGKIFTTEMQDIRRAINLEVDAKLGNHTLTPGFSYSKESDYTSHGISLSDAISFNEKNTILQLGASHNFDSVQRNGNPFPNDRQKHSTEAIIGLSQLLSPKTTLNADFTFGYESGYLNDPYRQVEFIYPGHAFGQVLYENRPSEKYKEVVLISLNQFVERLNGSVEVSYRFYHDSFDIYAHTAGLTWHQWLGKHLMLEPAFRLYEQGSASFYSPLFHSDPMTIPNYSADYRLSNFYSLDVGLQATLVVNRHLRITAGYHRYEMHGLDNTVAAMYPKANVITAGLTILW